MPHAGLDGYRGARPVWVWLCDLRFGWHCSSCARAILGVRGGPSVPLLDIAIAGPVSSTPLPAPAEGMHHTQERPKTDAAARRGTTLRLFSRQSHVLSEDFPSKGPQDRPGTVQVSEKRPQTKAGPFGETAQTGPTMCYSSSKPSPAGTVLSVIHGLCFLGIKGEWGGGEGAGSHKGPRQEVFMFFMLLS